MKLTSDQWRERAREHRKHDHYRVFVTYTDGEVSSKVYTNKVKAEKFAARQDKSPVVKSTKVVKLK